MAGTDRASSGTGLVDPADLSGPGRRTSVRRQLFCGAPLRGAVGGQAGTSVPADGVCARPGIAGGSGVGGMGDRERQAPPSAFVSFGIELFTQGLQRSYLAADD